ncbi:MAG TPA: TauD/TfdA family dioxygenase [Rhodocyclaceae bacterium]
MAADDARGLPPGNPFALDDEAAYRRWREWKLDHAPRRVEDLLVPIADLAAPTATELAALTRVLRRANMALYASVAAQNREEKQLPMALGARLGLTRLDANWLADEDGVSSITPAAADSGAPRPDFIPYTTQPIRWHTDGYYNPPERTIRAMILHCVRPASKGGANALLDHEIAYIMLRDESPEWIRALSAPDAMTIPARRNDDGEARSAQSGPVFSVDAETGDLHMRYTARTRSIVWKGDAATAAAVARLSSLLDGDARSAPHVFRLRQESGMGLVCNNVLHDRAAFADGAGSRQRLLYRARYYDRIAPTVGAWRIDSE